MAYRKSKCPVCKVDSYKEGKDELCRDCMKIYEIGKDHLEQVKRGDVVLVEMDSKFTYGFYKPDQMPEKFDGYRFPSLLAELAGGKYSRVHRRYSATVHLGGVEPDATTDGHVYEIPGEKVEALGKVIDAIYRMIAWHRAESIDRGQNVLKQLASGEMALEDFYSFEKHYIARSDVRPKNKKKGNK